MHLSLGKMEHKPFKRIGSCFFIVENSGDKEFVSKQIRQLAVAGCRNFVFYGKYSYFWHMEADLELALLYPDESSENVHLTMDWNELEEFVEDILLDISERSFVPCENYLLYDDRDVYEIVVKRLSG